MTYNLAQVYLVQNVIRGHDKMIVKIGVSMDTGDRIKGLQTCNAFKIEEIASFDAGREAFKHERHLHDFLENGVHVVVVGVHWFV